jgi:hypothetical protein
MCIGIGILKYVDLYKEKEMKQMIVLLSTVILGIAIAAMVLSFKDTTQGLTDSAKAKMENALGLDGPAVPREG